jgi:hypothetical protein
LSNLKSDVAYREKIRLSWGEVLMGGVVRVRAASMVKHKRAGNSITPERV